VARGKRSKASPEEPTLVSIALPVEVTPSLRLARLDLVQGPGAPAELPLGAAEIVVGRSDDADLQVASPLLSRRHLLFRKADGRVRCEDLDSANGMYLNGVRAHAADLYEGDTIQIGDVVLVFREGQ